MRFCNLLILQTTPFLSNHQLLCFTDEKKVRGPTVLTSVSAACPSPSITVCLRLPGGAGTQFTAPTRPPVPTANADPAVSDSHLVPPERSLYLLTLKDKHEDILPSTHRSHSQGAQPPLPPPPPPPPFPPQTHICTCTPPLPTQRRL